MTHQIAFAEDHLDFDDELERKIALYDDYFDDMDDMDDRFCWFCGGDGFGIIGADEVFILDAGGLKGTWFLYDLATPDFTDFRQRKAYAYNCLADFVERGYGAGSQIELHCSQNYAAYLSQRAQTLGMTTSNPTEGLNLGQKLKWYTERS